MTNRNEPDKGTGGWAFIAMGTALQGRDNKSGQDRYARHLPCDPYSHSASFTLLCAPGSWPLWATSVIPWTLASGGFSQWEALAGDGRRWKTGRYIDSPVSLPLTLQDWGSGQNGQCYSCQSTSQMLLWFPQTPIPFYKSCCIKYSQMYYLCPARTVTDRAGMEVIVHYLDTI